MKKTTRHLIFSGLLLFTVAMSARNIKINPIPQSIHFFTDTDGDGIPDSIDADDDNDGIPDAVEQNLLAVLPIDTDRDNIPDSIDLDSDNDGIADILEAGFTYMSNGKDKIDPALFTDNDANGWHDPAQTAFASSAIIDTDGDGVADYTDLDSDNDSKFDTDEAGPSYGDGDINGDGKGDGADTDGDGILDIFDNLNGFGNSGKLLPQNTFGQGNADYRKTISQLIGITDISKTLYANLDTNNDGKIDSTADSDQDGLMDAFDSDHTQFGSPRKLNKKLYLELDGRNDYADAAQMLSSLDKATLMGWIKLNSNYTATGFIMGQDNFNLKVKMVGPNKQLIATAKNQSVTFSQNLEVDRWYHVAAVYDNSVSEKLALYVNGQKEATSASVALSGNLGFSAARFSMGRNATAATEYFKGALDEVRVFNTALSDDMIQKMVYQEIKQQDGMIRGEVIPRDIENTSWASLLAYFRMDTFNDNVIDNKATASVESGDDASFARIYNVKTLHAQLAPMPFVTTVPGSLHTAVSQNNFVNGQDARTYNWSIISVKHNINLTANQTSLGMIIEPDVTVNLSNNNKLENTWYLKLDGKIDLQGKSQLVQTINSELDPTSSGSIEREQQGQSNVYNYNYWCSPVGAINATTNNNSYTVDGVFRDATNPSDLEHINWTNGLDGAPTTPITLSGFWIFKFQNQTPLYANWASVGAFGSLLPAQGFTLKGSGAATPKQNYAFVGKPNNGTITTTIAPGNLNLSGNPYPSALNATKFIKDNIGVIDGTLYFWEHFPNNNSHQLADYQGGYATINLVGGTPPVNTTNAFEIHDEVPGRFVPVGQGFFVKAKAGGTLTFNNNQRAFVKEEAGASNILFRQPVHTPITSGFDNSNDAYEEDQFTRIRFGFTSATNFHRQVLLGFMNENATAALEPGYDAENIDTQPDDLYLMKMNNKLIIEGEGYFNIDNIYPIGVKTATQGTVKFMIDSMENIADDQAVYIYDNVTNLSHNIRTGTFEIDLPAGTLLNRFSIRFKIEGALGNASFANQQLAVTYTSNDNMITIANDQTGVTVKSALLFNMLGQSVATWDFQKSHPSRIQIPLQNTSTGTYIVKVYTTNGAISKKIVVK